MMANTSCPDSLHWDRRQAAEQASWWERLIPLRQRLYGAATTRMLEAARLKPGDHVLDIAAGTGDQSRQAARLVGPAGSILATDISLEMLEVAAQLAEREELRNIGTQVMDAQQLDLPKDRFDAVISRFGLMLIPDRQQAFTEIWRVLKPGGWLAGLVWSAPERNPLLILDDALLARFLRGHNPAEAAEQPPDAFSLADATLFASALTGVGFQNVQVQALPLTFSFASFETLIAWWGPRFAHALAVLDPASRQRLLEDAHQAVRPFERPPEGIVAPAEVLLGVGRKRKASL
jgi:ubiquinone/menaquinone biosynthesis C-methylase UbiE